MRFFIALYKQGHAHCVEAWQGEKLVGGLYGLALGGAFFAESMFSHAPNASKTCVVALVEKLRSAGFALCDVQFQNDHIAQFGVQEISRDEYRQRLKTALDVKAAF